ncbi:hypothetical protein RCL1_006763 [Eukaryota sp. TZLM3-RCL]
MSSDHSCEPSKAVTVTNFKQHVVSSVCVLKSCVIRSNVLSQFSLLFQVLQLIALVLNRHFPLIQTDLDARKFLQFISLAGYDKHFWSILSYKTLTMMLPILTGMLIISGGSLLWITFVVKNQFPLLNHFFSIILQSTCSFLFLPLVITAFTHLHCSDDSLFFSVPLSECWTLPSVGSKLLQLSSLIALLFFFHLRSSLFSNIQPTSQYIFSCFDRRFFYWFAGVRVWLAITLTLLDHLPFVFRVSFPLSALLLTFLLIKWIPFYKNKGNKFATLLFSSFSFFSIFSFYFLYLSPRPFSYTLWLPTLTLYFSPLLLGFLVALLVDKRCTKAAFKLALQLDESFQVVLPKYLTKNLKFKTSLEENDKPKERKKELKNVKKSVSRNTPNQQRLNHRHNQSNSDRSKFSRSRPSSPSSSSSISRFNTDSSEEETSPVQPSSLGQYQEQPEMDDHLAPFFIKLSRHPVLVERYLRFTYSELNTDAVIRVSKTFIDQSISIFPNELTCFMFKVLFDLYIAKDPLAAVATSHHVLLTCDFDLSYFQEVLLYQCLNEANSMKREQSLGHALDSSTFLALKSKLKIATSRHHDCLEYLAAFFAKLVSVDGSEPDLSLLPALSDQIYQSKVDAELYFNTLLTEYPRNSEVLTAYSRFVREIVLDEEYAKALETSFSDGSSEVNDGVSESGRSEFSANKSKSKKKRSNEVSNFLLNFNDVGQKQSSIIKSLQKSLYFALFLLLVLLFSAAFLFKSDEILFFNQFATIYELIHFGTSSLNIVYSSEILKKLDQNSAHLFGSTFPNFPSIFDYLKDLIIKEAVHAVSHMNRVLIGDDITSSLYCSGKVIKFSALNFEDFNKFLKSSIHPKYFPDENFPISSSVSHSQSFFRFSNLISLFSFLSVTDNSPNFYSNFLTDNYQTITDGTFNLITSISENFNQNIFVAVFTCVLFIILSLLLIFFIAIFLFGKTLKQVDLIKISTFNSFLDISQTVVKHLLQDEKFADTAAVQSILKSNDVNRSKLEDQSNTNENLGQNLEHFIENEQIVDIFSNDESNNLLNFSEVSNISKILAKILIILLFIFIISLPFLTIQTKSIQNFSENFITYSPLILDFSRLQSNLIEKSRHLLEFITSENLIFYHSYLSSLHEIETLIIESKFSPFALNFPKLIDFFSTFDYYLKVINRQELIVLSLSRVAFDYSFTDMPIISNFHYNISDERRFYENFVEYDLNIWYENSDSDLLKSQEELKMIARNVLTFDYYNDLFSQMTSSLNYLDEIFIEIFTPQIPSSFFLLFYPIILMLFILITGYFSVLIFKKQLNYPIKKLNIWVKFSLIVLVFLSIVTVSTCFWLTLSLNSQLNQINQSCSIMNHVRQLKSSRDYELYSSLLFANDAKFWAFRQVTQSRMDFNSSYELLSSNHESQSVLVEILNLNFEQSMNILKISNILTANSKNLSPLLVPRNFEWNFSLEPAYSELLLLYQNYDWSRHYTSSELDLARPLEKQKELAQNLLISQIFQDDVQNFMSKFSNFHHSLHQNLVDKIMDYSFIPIFCFILSVIFFVISVILTLYSIVSAVKFNQKSRQKSTIRQNLEFPLTKQLSKRYLVALSLLSLVLFVFFSVCIFFFSSLVPCMDTFVLTSKRFLSLKQTQVAVTQMINQPSLQHNLIANHLINKLQNLQNDVIFSVISGWFVSTEVAALEFHFQILLAKYLDLVSSTVTSLDQNYEIFQSSSFELLTSLHSSCNELLLQYRDASLETLSRFSIIISVLLVIVSVFMLSEFIIVFRNLIVKLNQVEETILLLKSMSENVSSLPITFIVGNTSRGVAVPSSSDVGNIADLCRVVGIDIPSMCYHKSIGASGKCGLCVVSVKKSNQTKSHLVKACLSKYEPGMIIDTDSEVVQAARLRARQRLMEKQRKNRPSLNDDDLIDSSSSALILDQTQCISCLRCVKICSHTQGIGVLRVDPETGGVTVTPSGLKLAETSCLSCGQCSLMCPSESIREVDGVDQVKDFISNSELTTVAVIAPAVRIHFAEVLGLEPQIATDLLIAALRLLGFDYVFDVQMTADLTILEEANEFLSRLTTNSGPLPMFTSCCPSWVNYVEKISPEIIPNLSTAKSPQGMMGSVIKEYWAKLKGLQRNSIIVVSVMPCVAKIMECKRHQLTVDGQPDVDVVLTIRSFGKWVLSELQNPLTVLREAITSNPPTFSNFDSVLGTSTGAAAIFAKSGGVMVSALRYLVFKLTGAVVKNPTLTPHPHLPHVSDATVVIPFGEEYREVKVAVVNGIHGARKLIQNLKRYNFHFIEVMTCENGCLMSGGGPKFLDREKTFKKRIAVLNSIDNGHSLYRSDENTEVMALYKDFLGQPNSSLAHKLLHTSYSPQLLGTVSLSAKKHPKSTSALASEQHFDLMVVYATTNGTTEDAALDCASDLEKFGYAVKAINSEHTDSLQIFSSSTPVVFFMSTYGEGVHPDGASDLFSFISKNSHPVKFLKQFKYALFGLGSSLFPRFNAAAKSLDQRLQHYSAVPLVSSLFCDVSKLGNLQTCIDTFSDELMTVLPDFIGPPKETNQAAPKPSYKITYHSGIMTIPPPPPIHHVKCSIKSIHRHCSSSSGDVFEVVFNLPFNTRYCFGDDVYIVPEACEFVVNDFLARVNLDPDHLVSIVAFEGVSKHSFPPKITWKQFALEHLALQSCPSRKLCQNLSYFCVDPEERLVLSRWGTKIGHDELSREVQSGLTVVSLFDRFPSLKLSPDLLCTLLPYQKPRIYSSASSPSVSPGECRLLVANKSTVLANGKSTVGVSSAFFASLFDSFNTRKSIKHYLSVSFHPGNVIFPSSSTSPLVFIVYSVGIAPVLALLQERQRLANLGQSIGSVALVYATSDDSDGFFMESEISRYIRTHNITHFFHVSVESNDTVENFVVTTLKNQEEILVNYFSCSDFYLYCCGPSLDLHSNVEVFVRKSLIASSLKSDHGVDQAKIDHRWIIEAY